MKHQTDSLYTSITGGFISMLAYLIGGIDGLVISFVIVMVSDYITGLLAGSYTASLNSKKAFKGLTKKAAMIILVIVANQLDVVTGSVQSHFMRNAMIMFLIAVEGISIVENMGKMGVPVPKFLKDRLEQLQHQNSDKK